MSNNTTELRYLIQSGYNLNLKDYKIFDETYRNQLNQKLLDHYMFYEIGFPSADRFKFELNKALNEIMPLYNQRYRAELIEYDPFVEFEKRIDTTGTTIENVFDKMIDVINTINQTHVNSTVINDSNVDNVTNTKTIDLSNSTGVTDEKTKSSGLSSVISTDENDGKSVGSDTPVDLLTAGSIDGNIYASTATISKGSNESSSSTIDENGVDRNVENVVSNNGEGSVDSTANVVSNDVIDSDSLTDGSQETNSTKTNNVERLNNVNTETVERGNVSSKTKLLMELRDSFINIDMEVINDQSIKECFMLFYDAW